MRSRWKWFSSCLPIFAAAITLLRADPGDVENSRDYPGFPRLPGFIISDYTEDNPSEFTFSVARPKPIDANHVEAMPVKGHRYIIRYELGPDGHATTLLQSQKAYEKLATDAGYKLEKTGAVGDVTETFRAEKDGRTVWVCLEPSSTVNILTIVEAKPGATPPPIVPEPPKPTPPAVIPKPITSPAPVVATPPPAVIRPPTPAPSSTPPAPGDEDAFYTALIKSGRVVLPLNFLPGKPDLDADSQPVIDRVAVMMQRHPNLRLQIEGHTDNTGNVQGNLRLSEQRATTVRGMLIAEKIDRRRLTAVGLGGSEPLVKENTAEGRAQNRRIELVLKKDPGAPKEPPPKDLGKKAPAKDPGLNDADPSETAFHSTAPNGTNYYPAAKSDR